MVRTHEFQGKMLGLGRTARGMSQTELARAAGISQPLISLIELGERRASEEQASAFAKALRFPVSFFYRDETLFGPSLGETFHRRRHIGAKQLNAYYAWTNIKMHMVAKLLEPIDWPTVNLITPSVVDDEEVMNAARAIRGKWNVPQGPIQSVSDLLANAGVFVVPEHHGNDALDGMSVWINGLPPVIFVNADLPIDRIRFTLAHELGHLTMHYRSPLYEVSDYIEEQANLFASEFLMPAQDIRPQLRKLSLTKASQLKRYWQSSISSIIMRAKVLGCISSAEAQALWRELSKRGWRKNEPVPLDRSVEQLDQTLRETLDLNAQLYPLTDTRLEQISNLYPDEARAEILLTPITPHLRLVGANS